jgi:rare lipoprotein A
MLQRQTQAALELTPATHAATPALGEIRPPYIAPDVEPPNNPSKSPTLAPTVQAPTRWLPAQQVPAPLPSPAPAALSWGAELLPPNDLTSPLLGQGLASWYGKPFHGRRTASGERYDMHAFTAAHKTLPLGSRVRVRRVNTGQEVVVRINDRGPFVFPRIIDLSYAAAKAIGMDDIGLTEVLVLQD